MGSLPKKSPTFLPKFSNFRKSKMKFSIITILRREYAGCFSTIIGFLFVEIVRNYFIYENFKLDKTMIYIFCKNRPEIYFKFSREM